MAPIESQKKKRDATLPCPICGGTQFTWGSVVSDSLKFVSENSSFIEKMFNLSSSLHARVCNDCGNVQLFASDY